ncbi:hypothetical protein PFISCL1PPCAC_4097, partial [Pristionchus fissidentatus]
SSFPRHVACDRIKQNSLQIFCYEQNMIIVFLFVFTALTSANACGSYKRGCEESIDDQTQLMDMIRDDLEQNTKLIKSFEFGLHQFLHDLQVKLRV